MLVTLHQRTPTGGHSGQESPEQETTQMPGPVPLLLRLPICVLDRCSDIATEIQTKRGRWRSTWMADEDGRVGYDD